MNFALAQRIKAWYNAYSFHRNYIGSGIEVVITGLTRNQFAGNTARGFESHPLRQTALKDAFKAVFYQKK